MIQHKPTTYLPTFHDIARHSPHTHGSRSHPRGYHHKSKLLWGSLACAVASSQLSDCRDFDLDLCSLSGRADGHEPPSAKTSAVYNQTNNRK
jgi:hypothetical protein